MLSVIIPVYNVAPYLKDCLESLDNQTLNDIEFIIVNDGSTDGSDKICNEFIENKSKFKLIHKSNGGLMSAWMEGVKHISGDYIGFVDSDDYVDINMFNILYTEAKNKNADIVMCDRIDVYEDYQIIGKNPIEKGVYTKENLKTIRALIFPTINSSHITNARWNKIYRSDLFLANIKYCIDYSRFFEDRFIVPACMFSANSFIYIDKPLYFYRQRENSNHSKPSDGLYIALKLLSHTQKTMLTDKLLYEDYKTNWECANIDYIRLLINRNLNLKKNFKGKLLTLQQILNDPEYRSLIIKYKSELTSKLGLFLRISYRMNNPQMSLLLYEVMSFFIKIKIKVKSILWD